MDVIVDYMQANDLLTDCHHRSSSKRSCNTHLLVVMEDLTIAIAGDCKCFNFSSKSSILQNDQNSLQHWSDLWQIQFNNS